MAVNNLTRFHKRLIVAITLSAAFLSVLTQFLLITAFPKIMEEFSINSTQVQWLTTIYMLTIAVLIPITAFFIDRFRTRTLLLTAMSLFFIGTLLGMVSPTFSVLLVGRVFQGMGSGIMIPLMQTILFLVYPREKRGFATGMAGMVINVAPAIGPPLSGILVQAFDWRALFYLTLPIAAIIIVLIYLYMRDVTKQRDSAIDVVSILFSSIGFGGLLYGFNQLQEVGFEGMSTMISLSVGALSLVIFIIRQLRIPKPMLELRVLAVPLFSLVAFIAIISFTLLVAIETMLPMYVQNGQQFSAYYGGLIVMPGALTLAVMSLLAGNLFDKYGSKTIAIIGFTLLSISTFGFYFFLAVDTPFIITIVLFMISMAGVALINMPVMTAGINALPDELIPHGTSVFNTVRQFGGTLGLTFIISFITRGAGTGEVIPTDYVAGVKMAFFVSFIFSVVGLLFTFFIQSRDVSHQGGEG